MYTYIKTPITCKCKYTHIYMSEIYICIYTHAHSLCLQASWAVAIFKDLMVTDHSGTHPQEYRSSESQRTVRFVSSNVLQFHVAIPSHKFLLNLRNLFIYCPGCSHWKTIPEPHYEPVAKISPLIFWQNFFIGQFRLIFLLCQSFSLPYSALPFPFAYSFHFYITGKRDPTSAFNLLS